MIPTENNETRDGGPVLLPCPFCGRAAVIEKAPRGGYKIGCDAPYCVAGIPWAAKWIDLSNGVQAWNMRGGKLAAEHAGAQPTDAP
jgi:hypothetical protein